MASSTARVSKTSTYITGQRAERRVVVVPRALARGERRDERAEVAPAAREWARVDARQRREVVGEPVRGARDLHNTHRDATFGRSSEKARAPWSPV